MALTLVSGAHGVYGLGTVPSEPRQWLRGACGHIECTISRFVYLLELEVAQPKTREGVLGADFAFGELLSITP